MQNMSDHNWNAETVNVTIHHTDTRKSSFCAPISPDTTISPSCLFYIFIYIRIKFKDWKSYKSVKGCHKLLNYCTKPLPTQDLFVWMKNKQEYYEHNFIYPLCQNVYLENKNKTFSRTKQWNKQRILWPLFIRPSFDFLSTLYY